MTVGVPSELRAATFAHAPQIGLYAEAMRRVPGTKLLGCWLHFPLAGAMVELR